MNRKSIGIDLDSTLNTLDKEWMALYNEDYNDNIQKEDMYDWDVEKYIKPECGEKIYDYLFTPKFFLNLGVQEHSQKVTKFLSRHYDLYIVTAYHWKVCEDKARWIIKNFPHIDSKNIIFCNNKGLIGTDYLIDDGGHNIEAFKGTGLIYDARWNWYLANDYPRFKSWFEIGEYFENVIKRNINKV